MKINDHAVAPAFRPSAEAYDAVAPQVSAIIAHYGLPAALANEGAVTNGDVKLPQGTFEQLAEGQKAITRHTLAVAPLILRFREQINKAADAIKVKDSSAGWVSQLRVERLDYAVSADGDIQLLGAWIQGRRTDPQQELDGDSAGRETIDASVIQLLGWLINASDYNGDGRFQIMTEISPTGKLSIEGQDPFDRPFLTTLTNPHGLADSPQDASHLAQGAPSIGVEDIFNRLVTQPD